MTPFVNVLWGIQMLGTSSGGDDTNTTSHDVALPAGTEVGDVNVISFRISVDSGGDVTPTVITIPAGWALVGSHTGTRVVSRKRESGDPTTVTFTTDNDRRHAYAVHRWGGAHGDVEASAFGNPPGHNTVTPSWGSARTGYIAMISTRKTDLTFVAPANYGSQVDATSDAGGSDLIDQCSVSAAHRILASASEQPGDWGVTGTISQGFTVAIAVRPA